MGRLKIPIRKVFRWKELLLLLCLTVTVWDLHVTLNHKVQKKCSCDTCMVDEHPWFSQLYQDNMTLFMSSSYNLSQEDFEWWRRLYNSKLNLTSFNNITSHILRIFPGRPPEAERGPERCRSCAIVGNSGNLIRSHYGKLIDLHDYVFRINYGKTNGYEEHVGSRTTHRVMYQESATRVDNNTQVVWFPFKLTDLHWAVNKMMPVRKVTGNRYKVAMINPAFMKYVHLTWLKRKGTYPSTGFMTLILALHLCDEVSVFGFGADSEGNWSHYWHVWKNKHMKTGAHPGNEEYAMIEELERQGKVSFYRGL